MEYLTTALQLLLLCAESLFATAVKPLMYVHVPRAKAPVSLHVDTATTATTKQLLDC
jgi:hypothetical protein